MALAALAILGHKSAHSFPMGPVMAEPEYKNIPSGADSNYYYYYQVFNQMQVKWGEWTSTYNNQDVDKRNFQTK